MCTYTIRPILPSDDAKIAKIVRDNLKKFHLNIPGTAYFDKELDALSKFYNCLPEKRSYYVVTDENGIVAGGAGVAEFRGFENCAEVQKLYLADEVKGKGIGKRLLQEVDQFARMAGYKRLYLETHSNLGTAIDLYEKMGFHQIDKPESVMHNTMNRFYLKNL